MPQLRIQPRAIYNTAEMFSASYAALQKNIGDLIEGAHRKAVRDSAYKGSLKLQIPYHIPSIVCMCLAFELYLKCLIVLDLNVERPFGHDYLKLFNMLTDPTQEKVKRYFTNPHSLSYTAVKAAADKDGRSMLTFDEALERSRHAFERMRYVHETVGKGERAFHAGTILEGVRAVIREKKPNWPMLYPLPDPPPR